MNLIYEQHSYLYLYMEEEIKYAYIMPISPPFTPSLLVFSIVLDWNIRALVSKD